MFNLKQSVAYLTIVVCVLGALAFAWVTWGSLLSEAMIIIGIAMGVLVTIMDAAFGMQWYEPIEGVPLTRSTLFTLALIPLAVFVMTSSGSLLGFGIIVGLVASMGWGVIGHSTTLADLQQWWPITSKLTGISLDLIVWSTTFAVALCIGLGVATWR